MASKSNYEKQMEALIDEALKDTDKALLKALLLSTEELKRAMREKVRGQKKGSI